MRTVVALLTLAVVALGQDCGKSPCSGAKAAKKEAATLSARIDKLESCAAEGCKKSEAKLAALCKAAGAKDTKDLMAKVKAFEQYAPCGCDASKKKLAELNAVLTPQPRKAVVSGRLPVLMVDAKSGNAKAMAVMKQLCAECCPEDCGKDDCGKERGKGCGDDCGKERGDKLMARIRTIEASAANGCATSATTLAKLEAAMASLPTPSMRVARVLAGAQKGDTKSQALLKSLCEECCAHGCGKDCGKDCGKECGKDCGKDCGKECGKDCGEECGKDCGDKMVARIQALETSAVNGCTKSATKLARIAARLSGAAPAKKSSDCTGCRPEGGCPGQQ
jgi:hypothetical protein